MSQIFGYAAAELLGMHFSQVTHPEDVANSAQGYQDLLAGHHQTFEIEKRYLHQSGRIIWALVHVHLLRDAQGQPLYFLAHILNITARKQAEEKLKHSGEQMRALAARIETVREEDRSQIAREVHDDLGQSLTGLKLDLAWLARRLPESEAESRARAAEMSELIDATINSVRRISSELRPGVLDDLGLVAAVEWQAQEFERRTGVPCRFRSTGEFEELEARRATALFRILQEALTNVIRHAQASRVSVKLTREIEAAQIEIRDNGRGITREELSRPGSLGLLGMRERAFAFGGEVLVTGRPGHGTTVTARMPLAGPSRETELLTAADLLAEANPQPEPSRARGAGRKPKRKPTD
jgi:PAS domain S-box-containing protein